MPRYIDVDELQVRLERKKADVAKQRYTEGWNDCMMRVKSMVSKAPTADVAPVVHGRWIDNEHHGYNWVFICSNCNYVDGYPFNDRHNYCPNCGARMEEDEE